MYTFRQNKKKRTSYKNTKKKTENWKLKNSLAVVVDVPVLAA